jgi:beta-lactamase class A
MTTRTTTLRDKLRAIIERGPATGGVAVRHIERGETFDLDGDTPYPAASVFKIPVMMEAFRRMALGEFTLTDRWELTDADKSTGSGVLVRLLPGLQLTVRDLLTLMIIISDNTATDMLVRRLGAERITATMQELGMKNTVVAQGCRELLIPLLGEAKAGMAPHETARYLKQHPIDPDSVVYRGTRENNITTANEMVDLVSRIHTGQGLDVIGVGAEARGTMRRILLEQQLNDRMPRFLPPGVPVAHKTGSLSGPRAVRNDAGLLDLGESGTVALAFFTCTRVPQDMDPADASRFLTSIDEEIAVLTRAVYDHYSG